ncbi:MAG: hypothetical protein FWC67_01365 [Defluviitaleaceae bacterium]|nr:hypothetical protein [Defluviitaleaceae bacterium]
MYATAVKERVIEQEIFLCPLISRGLNEAECYDIQSVRNQFMKKDDLVPDFDLTLANYTCPKCPYNQM